MLKYYFDELAGRILGFQEYLDIKQMLLDDLNGNKAQVSMSRCEADLKKRISQETSLKEKAKQCIQIYSKCKG